MKILKHKLCSNSIDVCNFVNCKHIRQEDIQMITVEYEQPVIYYWGDDK